MASQFHNNEIFLRSLTPAQLEQIKQEAANLSRGHEAALKEQLQRLSIK